MKKALALVLALVLALSMAVSAFAANMIELKPVKPLPTEITKIELVEDLENVLYTTFDAANFDEDNTYGTVYYFALPAKEYKDLKLTANGNITAELVKYDPETMVVLDKNNNEVYTYSVYVNGEVPASYSLKETAKDVVLADKEKHDIKIISPLEGLNYTDAKVFAGLIKKDLEVKDTVKVVRDEKYVNIVKLTVADNFSAAYTEGTLKVEAYDVAAKANVAGKIAIVNDVTIFEYEQVKYAAENNAKGAALTLLADGYSDYETAVKGYGENYKPSELRNAKYATVVSTTAFRAIEGKNLTLNAYKGRLGEISVTLKEVAAGQKGVNFFAWADYTYVDANLTEKKDGFEDFTTISFGFLGNQIVKGKFAIDFDLKIDYYELRELFGLKVEEDDIINYYVIDQDNNVVKTIKVDYMTDDISENVEFTIEGENEKLGWYTLCLEVPATETVEGEANPNTGAESVVGVVAALAVVSVATAAAVSLKK